MEPKPNPFQIASLLPGGGGQTQVSLTPATAVVILLVTFVSAFLLGLCCGWMWRGRRL
jgi:hypothetical protein